MVVERGSGRERGGRGMLECNGVGRVEVGIYRKGGGKLGGGGGVCQGCGRQW